ncbi:MAG: hypothetical protein ACE5EB_08295 [Thermodesulfobacteriota bacterium]
MKESWEVIRLVYLIESTGQLLFEGGWGCQPFWLVEAYERYRVESFKRLKEKNDGR